jgi:HEAT repeat protein
MNDQENPSVRETALTALGTIGAPAIVQVQDAIYKALSDVDSNVRTAAVWCVG